jgi:hypothetical protein
MPGGTVFAGRSDAHTVSANATMTPFRRLSLATTVSYQYSRTTTFDNGSPSVVPYQGDTWWVIGSATYAINEATDIFASTSFASARFAQNNAAAGLPLGIDYNRYGAQAGVVRRFSKNLTGRLQYAYYAYQEPSSANLLNYTANQILAMLDVRW